uniref:Transmembrane protein n=1 Tax=Toxoplasma gondii (strain ATCC 50861 / VEG) TaxID=432359 RepID=A0A0F7V4N0_TOXGV|nr:TPA: hypothetical protein BN1205_095590 [Toxoplasma gondii VEG]
MAEFTWRPLLMSLPKMIAFFHILLFSGALAAAAGSPAAGKFGCLSLCLAFSCRRQYH